MTPLVSILIPAYNAESWIDETIRSAIAQTWGNKEIIIVNDGASDQTWEIAKQFESESVRVVTQPNQGASATRNFAFSLSRGEYIQWLDADDLLSPDKIAQQMQLVIRENLSSHVLLSCGWGYFMFRSHRAEFRPTSLWRDLAPVEWLLCKMEGNVFMQTSTWLVSRQLSEAVGPWNTALSEDDDGEYFARVLLASKGVRFMPEGKVYYRDSGANSLSYTRDSPKKLESHWRSMLMQINYLRSVASGPRVDAACVAYLRSSLLYFYACRKDIVEHAQKMAADFGGNLPAPALSWKYSWIKAVFGWKAARWAELSLQRFSGSLRITWDRVLFLIERAMGLTHQAW